VVYDGYMGQGYGIPSPECLEAIRLVARTEGIFLDPVFTGKAMAGMIDLIPKKRIGQGEKVLFLHTGGWPALFA
jgi:1-aminocyclopropane-1-carboxylate deaminase/D-cysteine desulfhydrase-like pyridoxal-dependent ACC family enzyme